MSTQPTDTPTRAGFYWATRKEDGRRWVIRVNDICGRMFVIYPLGSESIDNFTDYAGPFLDPLAPEATR